MQILKILRIWLKIEPAMPTSILNFKWAWHVQFLSHTYQTLENYSFFVDEQMMLLSFFYISNQMWENLEKPIFYGYSRPLTVKIWPFFTESGLEQQWKFGFSKFSHFRLAI